MSFTFKVNSADVKTPSKFGWSLMDISAADSGRVEADALMYKNRVAQKEKIELEWAGVTTAEASAILNAFQDEYFTVTYHSPLTNGDVTKTFYRGDATAPYYWWVDGGRMENVAFSIIER